MDSRAPLAYVATMLLRRVLALVCLTRCAAPPPAEAPPTAHADAPGPADSSAPAVPGDMSPVPSTSPVGTAAPTPLAPLRLLHADVQQFGVRDRGDLLIEPEARWIDVAGEQTWTRSDLVVLDPASGAVRPWSTAWTPTDAGWKLRRGSEPDRVEHELSRDGRWVALGLGFTPRRRFSKYERELVAIVVARSDGSEPRCVGVGVPGDDPPPFDLDGRGRVLGDWSVDCTPDRRGDPVPLRDDGDLYAGSPLRWYDPADGARGEIAGLEPWGWSGRDPLGDLVWAHVYEPARALAFFDLGTGGRLGAIVIDESTHLEPRAWVTADMMLVDVAASGTSSDIVAQKLVTADGREHPAPHPGWRVYTRLPSGEHLFSRDGGATVEQGRVDWPRFTVATSRRRPELDRFAGTATKPWWQLPTWRPGLGGVLIHDIEPGDLYLAAI